MDQDTPQTPLARLNPLITLSRAPARADGAPSWTLHNPLSNAYFRIDWAEFECLARFSTCGTVEELIDTVNTQTTLKIDTDDVEKLISFLNKSGLLLLRDQRVAIREQAPMPLWKKLLHSYLFFTLPLLRPDNFLQRTLPFIRPLLSRRFITIMLLILAAGIIFTLQRADEFFHTFTQVFSPAGIIIGLIVFAGLKILHEMAHAFTAAKYGVRVPHMGIAFIVMYPVLYTETTGSWQLSSRQQRLHIGLAGILAELCAAGVFLWIWNIAPAGSIAQSIAFTTVAISLIGSLFVNLNPLMRFDGYYMMCDITGLDNLQGRACEFARWRLRRFLFGLNDSLPESLPHHHQHFLTWFGLTLLVYRFFLFTGIAVLVYTLFPKPLGPFLMAVELSWFIILPIWAELKIWAMRRADIFQHKRAYFTTILILVLGFLAVLPWQRTMVVPAIAHAADYAAIYPVADSYVEALLVHEDDHVITGQVLARLSADTLEKDLTKTRHAVQALEEYRRRLQADPAQARPAMGDIDAQIDLKQQALTNLIRQKEQLIITAPFDGSIRDFNSELHEGRYVRKTDLLFRVINPAHINITAYVDEQDLTRLHTGAQARFIPSYAPFTTIPVTLEGIDTTSARLLPWAALSSVYGGPIASSPAQQNGADQGQIEILQSLYGLHLVPTQKSYLFDKEEDFSKTGTVRLEGRPQSLLAHLGRSVLALFVRESGLN